MTKKEYLKLVETEFAEIFEMIKKKNADYSGAGDDPFANFSMVQHLGICEVETGILTRLSDKFSRAVSVIKKGKAEVASESAEDTLRDIIGYSILLLGYLKSKQKTYTKEEFETLSVNHIQKQFDAIKLKDDLERINKHGESIHPAHPPKVTYSTVEEEF